jgi:hypothetical protein
MTKERNIYQRLAAAMEKVTYVQKDNTKAKGLKYNVVTHDAVTAKVRPALLAEGIVYHPLSQKVSQNGNRTEVEMVIRFVNIDNPEDHIDVPTFGYGIDQQDKGPGKAVSYAVKYALLKTLGLETGDDADLDTQAHEITPEQFVAMRDLAESCGANIPVFLKIFGAQSMEQFPPAKYDDAMKKLNKKAEKSPPAPPPQTHPELNGDSIPY